MMEKIDIKDCLSALPNGASSKIVGVSSGNKSVLSLPNEITDAAGCGYLDMGNMQTEKWYRIAFGKPGSFASSTLLNICRRYNSSQPSSQLFYVYADGYTGNQKITMLSNAGKSVLKARILYKASTTEKTILDIYISSNGVDGHMLAHSCNFGFVFQAPVEVSDTPDNGYSVKEFTF